jgi:glycosyltransferase
MRRPKISFVTPTYNASATVPDAIASVEREASGLEYEHIFVDGGSTDGTIEAILRLKGAGADVVSEPDNGVYDAMNKGIRRAKGEWVAILNADDYYLRGAVRRMLDAADRGGAGLVHGDVVSDRDGGEFRMRPDPGLRGRIGAAHALIHPATWVRRDIYERHGLYNVHYWLAADQEFFYRVLDRGERTAYVPEPITFMGPGGLSGRHYDAGTLELLDIHARRRSLAGLAAHVLFYRKTRLRFRPDVPRGPHYWAWAARDFMTRRLRRGECAACTTPT